MFKRIYKSNVPKVRVYCSASDHLIRKIFLGVCRDIHWFEEYLKIIEIYVHFFNERSFYAFLTPLTCLDHMPFELLLFGPSRYKFTVKIRALAVIIPTHPWKNFADQMNRGRAISSNLWDVTFGPPCMKIQDFLEHYLKTSLTS